IAGIGPETTGSASKASAQTATSATNSVQRTTTIATTTTVRNNPRTRTRVQPEQSGGHGPYFRRAIVCSDLADDVRNDCVAIGLVFEERTLRLKDLLME